MESLHYLLMKTHTKLNRKIISRVTEQGFSPGQPKVLECLSKREGIEQKTIARYCEIEPVTVGGILLRMEQAGLIERRQKDGNRRSLFVYLTESGRQAADKINAIFAEEDHLAEQGLSPEEIKQLKILLEKLNRSLELSAEE
ncbi:MAG: MarR family transcriptional regulator [Lachnospiraceae bacterium]|nr:MarR family transcriptional regulator [Lachnospiraceae bacterium]